MLACYHAKCVGANHFNHKADQGGEMEEPGIISYIALSSLQVSRFQQRIINVKYIHNLSKVDFSLFNNLDINMKIVLQKFNFSEIQTQPMFFWLSMKTLKIMLFLAIFFHSCNTVKYTEYYCIIVYYNDRKIINIYLKLTSTAVETK
jgi:penicillin-binding protein-related factor A (putative recombinase)